MAGMIAEDVWKGLVEQASWEECFEREDIVKLDVRSKELFDVGEKWEFNVGKSFTRICKYSAESSQRESG